MSLWEKMMCQGCPHPRHRHYGDGSYKVYGHGSCHAYECNCPSFKEPEEESDGS